MFYFVLKEIVILLLSTYNDVHIIATPTRRNKTIFDYNNNILDHSECMSAILGGANSIKNFNYDSIYKNEN